MTWRATFVGSSTIASSSSNPPASSSTRPNGACVRPVRSKSASRSIARVWTNGVTTNPGSDTCARRSAMRSHATATREAAGAVPLVAESERAEADRQHAARDHGREHPTPSPMVGDPADAGPRDGRAEHVAEETGKAGGGAGSLLGYEIEGVQANDHYRSVDEEADRNERRVVDPQRALHVQPVHDDGDQRQCHEQHGRRGTPALEPIVRDPAAGDRPGNRRGLIQRPPEARLLE